VGHGEGLAVVFYRGVGGEEMLLEFRVGASGGGASEDAAVSNCKYSYTAAVHWQLAQLRALLSSCLRPTSTLDTNTLPHKCPEAHLRQCPILMPNVRLLLTHFAPVSLSGTSCLSGYQIV